MNNFAMNQAGGTQLMLLLLIAHFTISPGKPISKPSPSHHCQIGTENMNEHTHPHAGRCHELEMRPVESTQYQVVEAAVMMGNQSHIEEGRRRRLEPFQLCLVCKCCAAPGGDPATGTCASMSCCFGIDCQLPNKPFGVCAFVPKTCNCTSCAV